MRGLAFAHPKTKEYGFQTQLTCLAYLPLQLHSSYAMRP